MTSLFQFFSHLDKITPEENSDHVRKFKREILKSNPLTPGLNQGQNFNRYQQKIFKKYEKEIDRVNSKEGFQGSSSSSSSSTSSTSKTYTSDPSDVSGNSATQQSNQVLSQTQISSSQTQSYDSLKQEYISTLARYRRLMKEIQKNAKQYLARVSPKNPYLNKIIQFRTGQAFYVTNQGNAKYISQTALLNNPKIKSMIIPINIRWDDSYQNPGTVIPTKPSLVVGTNLSQGQLIGNEGSNVFVSSGIPDPSYNYIGCYADSSTTRGLPNSIQSGNQNYTPQTCMQAAIDRGDTFFGLQNVDLTTGMGSCWTGTDQGQATQYGGGQQNCTQQSDGYFYGGYQSNSVYQTPTATIVGDYVDKPNRAMIPVNKGSQTYTYETCMQYALDASYQFFSLQNINKKKTAGECYVSNDFTTASQYGVADKNKNKHTIMHKKGTDGYWYGTKWFNFIYEITGSAPYEGCYNDPSGNSMTAVKNGKQKYSYDSCQQYASDNGYKYFGLQNVTNGPGTAQCYVSNSLSDAQQFGEQQACPKIGSQTFGSNNVNALYNVRGTNFNSSQIGTMGYIDENSNLYTYPDSSLELSTNYTQFTQYDSPGNDIGAVSGSTVNNCETLCTTNDDCYGFVYDNSNNICYPKTSGLFPQSARQPSKTTDLYVRQKSISTLPTGVSSNVKNISSVEFNLYSNNGENVGSSYGLANVSSTQKQELEQIQSTLKSLAQQIVDLNGTFNENDILVNSQSELNMQSVDQYLDQLNMVQKELGMLTSDNVTNILNDSDIVVLQENYNYMFWSILALGSVLVAMAVAKK